MKDDKVLKVTEDVSWIGVLDPDIRTFDVVMTTKSGTTYNSYFINAEKKTIIETAKEKFWDTYIEKVRQVVNPEEIDYIVLNHTEPDHSGCLANLLKIATKATVVASGSGIRYLTDLVGFEFPHLVVKDGQILDLGNKRLQFLSAPNLHWPDTMFTYLWEDKLLFTCDVFGEHFCNEAVFDDLVGNFDDAFCYYFKVILSPFSKFLLQAIEKIRPLQINAICTGHGAVLRTKWKHYVDLSEHFAREALKFPIPNKILIAYVSAYGKTALIAEKIAEGISQAGDFDIDLCNIEKIGSGILEQKIIQSSGLILGCPTFNQNILMPIYQVLSLINPIRDRGKLVASFGSYGWSGEATKLINSGLAGLKMNVMDEGLMVKFTPHNDGLEKCIAYGRAFGAKLLEKQ